MPYIVDLRSCPPSAGIVRSRRLSQDLPANEASLTRTNIDHIVTVSRQGEHRRH